MKTLTSQVWWQYLLPQHLLSRTIGWLASCRCAGVKNTFIRWFVRFYKVDMREAEQPDPTQYACFNDFFTRTLRADTRPIDAGEHSVVSPADGFVSAIGAIDHDRIIQAKGFDYNLSSLLGGRQDWVEQFQGGQFVTLYLSPRDYHRVHSPLAGQLKAMLGIPGWLFAVNPAAVNHVPELFARNERVVTFFDSPAGAMVVVLVGAMNVGSVATAWSDVVMPVGGAPQFFDYAGQDIQLNKGQELGKFLMGSTVIVLFGPNRVCWNQELAPNHRVLMGQKLGELYH